MEKSKWGVFACRKASQSNILQSPFFLSVLFLYEVLKFIFILYWSIVDLQHFVSFRCPAKWFRYTHTHTHSFSGSFPIQAITEYQAEFPVLYSRFLLIVYFIYSCVQVLILNSFKALLFLALFFLLTSLQRTEGLSPPAVPSGG